jgi:hypothetical protein
MARALLLSCTSLFGPHFLLRARLQWRIVALMNSLRLSEKKHFIYARAHDRGREIAGPSTSVGMTILWHPPHVHRETVQPSDRIVIPTEVEGPAVPLSRSWALGTKVIFHPRFIPPWVGKAGGQLRRNNLSAREPMFGCPILRAVGEGWDKQNVRGKGLGGRAVVSHPSLRARRMGHPNIGSGGREEKTEL